MQRHTMHDRLFVLAKEDRTCVTRRTRRGRSTTDHWRDCNHHDCQYQGCAPTWGPGTGNRLVQRFDLLLTIAHHFRPLSLASTGTKSHRFGLSTSAYQTGKQLQQCGPTTSRLPVPSLLHANGVMSYFSPRQRGQLLRVALSLVTYARSYLSAALLHFPCLRTSKCSQ